MQTDSPAQLEPDQSIGQQIDRMDRTIQNQQFLIQSLIKTFLKNSSSFSEDDTFKRDLNQINQRYEDINEQIILETSTFSAYDTAFSQIQNRLNRIETQLRQTGQEENAEEEESNLLIQNMKVDIECLKEQFTNLTNPDEQVSSKNMISILKTAFMTKFKKLKNHLKSYQESTNKSISSLRADLENLEMNGQEYHQEFTRLNSKIQNFQITLNYLRDQLNISDDPGNPNSKVTKEIESIKESIESLPQKFVLREDTQDYENKVNSIREKIAQFPLIAAQQEKCTRDVFNIQTEIDHLKNVQLDSEINVSVDYQKKVNSLIESQQKNDETFKKARKAISSLKSEIQELKQQQKENNQRQQEKVVTREIKLDEESPKIETELSKFKSNLDKQYRRNKQNETNINQINNDISRIHEDIESIFNKLNDHDRMTSSPRSNQNDDYSTVKKEIKKLKNELNELKSGSNGQVVSRDIQIEPANEQQSELILQRINQISSEQVIIIEQYNGLVSHIEQIKKELDNLDSRLNENEENNRAEIDLINRKVENISNDFAENANSFEKEENLNDSQNDEESQPNNRQNALPRNVSNRIEANEANLENLRRRTESTISTQNKLVTQFNELVSQLRQMKNQFSEFVLQNQQNKSSAPASRKASSSKKSTKTSSCNINDDEGEVNIMISLDDDDDTNFEDSFSPQSISSLRSTVSKLQSKVEKIEKALGSGDELSTSFLNKVRTEVNQLEREIANIKSNTPDVSTSGFKSQSNQITKLQRQYHNLKRNFEKHLILSTNNGAAQEGSYIDDEDSDSDNSLSKLINENATAGTNMQNSILNAIEKRVDEMRKENETYNSDLARKVEELEKKVKKMSKGSTDNDFEASQDGDLSERMKNLERTMRDLNHSNKNLTKDNNNIHSTIKQIQDSITENASKAQHLSDLGNLSERGVKKILSPKKSTSSPKGEKEEENIDKKLSQLYVQVNSYYSNMSNMTKSIKELTNKFEELRRDVNNLMMKSQYVNNRKNIKNTKNAKNDAFVSVPDYNDSEENE